MVCVWFWQLEFMTASSGPVFKILALNILSAVQYTDNSQFRVGDSEVKAAVTVRWQRAGLDATNRGQPRNYQFPLNEQYGA